jgi:ankyrin repeat protein
MVSVFLSAGADPLIANNRDMTPLMSTADPDIVRCLLDTRARDSVNDVNSLGLTALMIAACAGRPAVAELLLAARADPNAGSMHGWTGLMLAAFNGHTEAVRLLLAAGAVVEARDEDGGETALMLAAQQGAAEAARLLVEAGADVGAVSSCGRTVLMAACEGNIEVADGDDEEADEDEDEDEDEDDDYDSDDEDDEDHEGVEDADPGSGLLVGEAFRRVAPPDPASAPDPAVAALAVVQLLLGAGAVTGVDLVDDRGDTALALAAANGRAGVVQALLAAGADTGVANAAGRTALIAASGRAGCGDSVSALLEARADVEARDSRGRTALLHACEVGDVEVARLLLRAGARVMVSDADARTPVMECMVDRGPRSRLLEAQGEAQDEDDRYAQILVMLVHNLFQTA